MRFHWWCMRMANRCDRPGYPWSARTLDVVGGWAAKVSYRLSHGVWLP